MSDRAHDADDTIEMSLTVSPELFALAKELGDGDQQDGARYLLREEYRRRQHRVTPTAIEEAVVRALERSDSTGAAHQQRIADAARWLAAEWYRAVEMLDGARIVPDDGGFRIELDASESEE